MVSTVAAQWFVSVHWVVWRGPIPSRLVILLDFWYYAKICLFQNVVSREFIEHRFSSDCLVLRATHPHNAYYWSKWAGWPFECIPCHTFVSMSFIGVTQLRGVKYDSFGEFSTKVFSNNSGFIWHLTWQGINDWAHKCKICNATDSIHIWVMVPPSLWKLLAVWLKKPQTSHLSQFFKTSPWYIGPHWMPVVWRFQVHEFFPCLGRKVRLISLCGSQYSLVVEVTMRRCFYSYGGHHCFPTVNSVFTMIVLCYAKRVIKFLSK